MARQQRRRRYLVIDDQENRCRVRWYGGLFGHDQDEDREYWAPGSGGRREIGDA